MAGCVPVMVLSVGFVEVPASEGEHADLREPGAECPGMAASLPYLYDCLSDFAPLCVRRHPGTVVRDAQASEESGCR